MRKLSCAAFVVAGLLGVAGTSQAYETRRIHGSSCFALNPTMASTLSYSQWGATNSGTSGIYVSCPLALSDEEFSSIKYFVFGWSRNSVAKLQCTLTTTGTSGDASASSTAFVPYNLNAAKSGSATTVPVANVTAWAYLTCYIPGTENGWMSYLSTIMVRALD